MASAAWCGRWAGGRGSQVWQTKDLRKRVFGSVAMIRLSRRFSGSVARKGLRRSFRGRVRLRRGSEKNREAGAHKSAALSLVLSDRVPTGSGSSIGTSRKKQRGRSRLNASNHEKDNTDLAIGKVLCRERVKLGVEWSE